MADGRHRGERHGDGRPRAAPPQGLCPRRQSGGTRGAKLLRGDSSIRIHGEMVPVRAEVLALDNLSAHADYAEIVAWLAQSGIAPRRTFITHGEPAAADAMRSHIGDSLGWECVVPDYLQTVELG